MGSLRVLAVIKRWQRFVLCKLCCDFSGRANVSKFIATFFVVRHIHREGNRLADRLATTRVLGWGENIYGGWRGPWRPFFFFFFVRVWFGGGEVGGVAGTGIVVGAAWEFGKDGLPCWNLVGGLGSRLRSSGVEPLVTEILVLVRD